MWTTILWLATSCLFLETTAGFVVVAPNAFSRPHHCSHAVAPLQVSTNPPKIPDTLSHETFPDHDHENKLIVSRRHRQKRSEPLIRRSEIPGLLQMARLNTVPMGMGLVLMGAYGARHVSTTTGAPLPLARLILGTCLTVITTSGSMLINDYYDHRDGIDNAFTKPNRPLVTKSVRPSAVKLVLKYAYALHLILICLVDSLVMRLLVLANTLLTYLYSVHLKPITGVKNMICATIVAMAVGLGAVAWDAPAASALRCVYPSMAAVAGVIWHREIVMDIKDQTADASVGVQTLPVKWGARVAHTLSLLPLGAAVATLLWNRSTRTSVKSLVAAGALLVQGLLSIWSRARNFDDKSSSVTIEAAPLWLSIALIALTST